MDEVCLDSHTASHLQLCPISGYQGSLLLCSLGPTLAKASIVLPTSQASLGAGHIFTHLCIPDLPQSQAHKTYFHVYSQQSKHHPFLTDEVIHLGIGEGGP
jgi:hypothetical protein